MSIKRVLAFTGIRSDYDLMSGLYKKIISDQSMNLGLIVSGAHLSDSFGYTVQYIENDKMPILAKIESLLDANSRSSRIKSAAIMMQCVIHHVVEFGPDIIIYAGDREDAMVGAMIAAYLEVPTIHFFGGDHTSDGNVDNAVRHSISKLSSLHFVSHESHAQRLLKMGETQKRIFQIGSPALDKYLNEIFIEKNDLLKELGRPDWQNYAILIFHPILGQEDKAGEDFNEILSALKELKLTAFVSYPNIDAGNRQIVQVIDKYRNDRLFSFYKNMKRTHFVNLMRQASFLIGNSSAGVIEAPIVPLGAINVGRRQRGRYTADNVIFVEQSYKDIKNAIKTVMSNSFQEKLKHVKSPYGDGYSVDKAYYLIKDLNVGLYKLKVEDPLFNE